MSKTTEQFLNDLGMEKPEQFASVRAAMDIYTDHGASPELETKYGGIVYLIDGQLVGGIYSYKDHISLEFSNGTTFDDPKGMLQGKGKDRRHLKITAPDDLAAFDANGFIAQAVGR